MTHEQFMGLRVGDIVDYCGTKYEITKTYNNGFGIETNGFVVENKTANYSLTSRIFLDDSCIDSWEYIRKTRS